MIHARRRTHDTADDYSSTMASSEAPRRTSHISRYLPHFSLVSLQSRVLQIYRWFVARRRGTRKIPHPLGKKYSKYDMNVLEQNLTHLLRVPRAQQEGRRGAILSLLSLLIPERVLRGVCRLKYCLGLL